MAEAGEGRVAVYIDFDNIVISRYDQIHGRGAWRKDNVYRLPAGLTGASDEIAARLKHADVDIGAILDFASSFGSIVLSRAYADWSVGVNASYQGQLMERSVDLTQLFPATQQMKNGADIRLAVDVVEDLFRLPDISHVVIAAGDSDYIALAQRAKRLGRYIVGIGVSGGTSKSLKAACNEYADYDALPGIRPAAHIAAEIDDASNDDATAATTPRRASTKATTTATAESGENATSKRAASALLVRALRLVHEADDTDWAHASALKQQMKRLDPAFNEKALGYNSFTSFLKSRANVVELDESSQTRLVRLRE
ncbi:MAG: NYN domain-containing protein [Microcella sp.]|uniref:NYN domain-containing protein n=1 Tax=Microcella sp. TaxID=1913979 RepID=UPI0024CB83DE|nr:NYN domain-containing protein [Microcella sp.]UYN84721.1 MAG: NYN domain-containing protein [Microcella sp.]